MNGVHASEVGLCSADDAEILSWCRSNQAVAVTLDRGFPRAVLGRNGTTYRGDGISSVAARLRYCRISWSRC